MNKGWKSSFHGGHSGQFCVHPTGSLIEIVESAISKGLDVYGPSEHSPRYDKEHVFQEEVDNGYDVEKLIETFEAGSIS